MGISIEWSVSIGQLLTMIVPAGGLIGAAYVMREKVNTYIDRVDALEKKLGQIVEILLAQERFEGKLATFDERMLSQGRRIDSTSDKLDRHLEFHSTVVPLSRKGLVGETT